MEVDPLESITDEPATPEGHRLNTAVAITVAILATFMGICKVKDDNIVQAMQQAQADKLDHWAYYQARTIRAEVAESTVVQLRLAMKNRSRADRDDYQREIAKFEAIAADQVKKRDELKHQAERDQQNYDAFNYRDDQFDLSDALLAIAIALLAVTALTRLWWLYWISLVPTAFGILMGVAGLLQWQVHPDKLIHLLS
jgi:hypothetical protein